MQVFYTNDAENVEEDDDFSLGGKRECTPLTAVLFLVGTEPSRHICALVQNRSSPYAPIWTIPMLVVSPTRY